MNIPAPVRRHPFVFILGFLVIIPLLVYTLWAAIALHYTYSAGERAGFLQKISKRGWVCKTWEGELQMVAVPGSMPEKFLFTVRSDSIASVLNGLAGQRVALEYQQHVGVPGSCFGDTEYFVVGVKPLGPP
jgi:hypothetical protein